MMQGSMTLQEFVKQSLTKCARNLKKCICAERFVCNLKRIYSQKVEQTM